MIATMRRLLRSIAAWTHLVLGVVTLLSIAAAPLAAGPPRATNAKPAAPPGKSKANPPAKSSLPQPASAGLAGAASAPLPLGGASGSPTAWIDEANLLPAGSASISMYVSGWHGTAVSETDAPVVDAAVGLTPRLQVGANLPHIVGNPDAGTNGGLGTTYFTAKIGLLTDGTVKVAVAPTLRLLGTGARESLPTGESALQWGLPVIAEVDRGSARVFASTGYFAHDTWFAGGGVGVQASPRVGVTVSLSRAWVANDPLAPTAVTADRTEVSGAVSYALTPQIAAFGSVARTVATTDENGAGVTVAAGVSIFAKSAFVR